MNMSALHYNSKITWNDCQTVVAALFVQQRHFKFKLERGNYAPKYLCPSTSFFWGVQREELNSSTRDLQQLTHTTQPPEVDLGHRYYQE